MDHGRKLGTFNRGGMEARFAMLSFMPAPCAIQILMTLTDLFLL
jgi:hypothetical protein